MVPDIAVHKTHQWLQKFSFVTPKRLLQQYLPKAEVAASFDHLVGQSKERRRYFDANCAGGLQIDRERQPRGS